MASVFNTQFSRGYRLAPSNLENAFRTNRLFRDKRQASLIYSLALGFLVLYLPVEVYQRWNTDALYLVTAARILAIAVATAVIVSLPRIASPRHVDRLVFAGAVAIILQRILTTFTTVDDPVPMVAWDLVALFVLYTCIPIPPPFLIGVASLLRASSLWIWATQYATGLSVANSVATPLAYFAANLFGCVFAIHINRANRKEFLSLNHETQMQDELMETMAALRETLQTRDRLFSILGHDLRGPMGSLASLGEYMIHRRAELSEEQLFQLLESIRKGSRESYELLDNLLLWSLSETDALKLELERVDLESALSRAIAIFELEAENKGVSLSYQNQVEQIEADPKMLGTILRNLVGNAVKHTPQGGQVKLKAEATGREQISISVTDTGVGISDEAQSQLFQLKSTTRKREGESGTGLGLKLCRDFAQRHGGSISVQSEKGKGSCFTVTLPSRNAMPVAPQRSLSV